MEDNRLVYVGEDGQGEIKFRVYFYEKGFCLNIDSKLLEYKCMFDYFTEEHTIYNRLINVFESHCSKLFHSKILDLENFISYRDALIEIATEVSELDYFEMRNEKFSDPVVSD